jgi:integrase
VKESTAKWAEALINRMILPYWGDRLVSEITKKEVTSWHKSPELRGTPSQADAALRVLSKIFNLSCEEDWRTDNPAQKLQKLVRGADKVRERTLCKAERKVLERTLRAMEAENASKAENAQDPKAKRGIEPVAAAAIRVLLLTAMRLQECLTLRWDEFSPGWDSEEEGAEPGWISKADHKSSRRAGAKSIAITPQLREVLNKLPRRKGSPWVFPSPLTPKHDKELGHFIGLQKVWERVKERVTKDEEALVLAKKKRANEAINIKDVHLHDLRRTALSITYGDEGQSIEALSKVAGHASTTTTERVYAHVGLEKQRAASEMIAIEIAADMNLGGEQSSKSESPT